MDKTIASVAGLSDSSGADVKNLYAAPIPALVIPSSLAVAGVFGTRLAPTGRPERLRSQA